jgi:hypothetical protein
MIEKQPEALAVETSAVTTTAPRTSESLPNHLASLADKARDYVKAASSANTNRAYDADWRRFNAWRRRQGSGPSALRRHSLRCRTRLLSHPCPKRCASRGAARLSRRPAITMMS